MEEPRRLGLLTATLLVVATMIGTGVFTTTGYMVRDVGSGPAILLLWVVGGVAALCGALAYAELASAMPRNGGDYHLLSRIYHPSVGFVAGFISLVVGFAAPVAGSAIALGAYLQPVIPWANPTGVAIAVIAGMSAVHGLDAGTASATQNAVTLPKIALIVVLIGLGLWWGDASNLTAGDQRPTLEALFSAPAAASLVFVAYAYSGWNGAVYIAGEVDRPAWTIPRALVLGTACVTVLYGGLNLAFLVAAPPSALHGDPAVAQAAAGYLAGPVAAKVVSVIIAAGLLSAVGAMIMAGPRIYAVMGEDYRRLGWLSRRAPGGAPRNAILLQGVLSVVMVLTASFEALVTYMGVTLSAMAALGVGGVFVLRRRAPDMPRPYRTFGYPFTPLAFLALTGWMIVHALGELPASALASVATLGAGFLVWIVVRER